MSEFTVLLLILKACGIMDISWWVVFAPTIFDTVIVVIVLTMLIIGK